MRGSTSGAQTGRNWLLGACSQAAKLRTGCIARQRDMSTERSGVRMGTAVLEKNERNDSLAHWKSFLDSQENLNKSKLYLMDVTKHKL